MSRFFIIVHIYICTYTHTYIGMFLDGIEAGAYNYHFSLCHFFVSLRWNSLNGSTFPLYYVLSSTVTHCWTAVMFGGTNMLHNRLTPYLLHGAESLRS